MTITNQTYLNVAFGFFPIRQFDRFGLVFVLTFPSFLFTQKYMLLSKVLLIIKISGLLNVFSCVFLLHERCHGNYVTRHWDEWGEIWTL